MLKTCTYRVFGKKRCVDKIKRYEDLGARKKKTLCGPDFLFDNLMKK